MRAVSARRYSKGVARANGCRLFGKAKTSGVLDWNRLTCIIHEVRRQSLKALPKKQAGKLPEQQSVFEVRERLGV